MTIFKNFELTPEMANLLQFYSCGVATCILIDTGHSGGFSREVSFIKTAAPGGWVLMNHDIRENVTIGDMIPYEVKCVERQMIDLEEFKDLNNHKELAAAVGVTTTSELEKQVYKAYACGPWIEFHDGHIEVGSIVEGSDAEVGPHELWYPFTLADYNHLLDVINFAACELWEEANEDG